MKSNIKKYVFYALGEVLLVVIGILIALQVNTWNEQRKQNALERDYLERFINDLEADMLNLNFSVKTINSRKERATFLISTFENPELVDERPNYFMTSIEFAGYTYNPNPNITTFDEITSSGRLPFIENKVLRSEIAQYYTSGLDYKQFDFIIKDLQLQYLNARKGLFSPQQQIEMSKFSNNTAYSVETAKAVYQKMITKKSYIELLPLVVHSQNRRISSFERQLKKAEELKLKIEQELNK
jgi:hypothetical protein